MTTEQLTQIELTTECSCEIYDEEDKLIPANDCLGCYDDALEYLHEKLGEWTQANGWADDAFIRVLFSDMGWQRLSGYGDFMVDDIPQLLTLKGDYRIVFTFSADNLTLTACRYSHDEPVGTGTLMFTWSPVKRCDYCGDPAECSQLDDQLICGHCKEWKGI